MESYTSNFRENLDLGILQVTVCSKSEGSASLRRYLGNSLVLRKDYCLDRTVGSILRRLTSNLWRSGLESLQARYKNNKLYWSEQRPDVYVGAL